MQVVVFSNWSCVIVQNYKSIYVTIYQIALKIKKPL